MLTANFNVGSMPNVSGVVGGHAVRRRGGLRRLRRRRRHGSRHHKSCCNGSAFGGDGGGGHRGVCVFDLRSLSGSSVVDVIRAAPAFRHAGAILRDVRSGTVTRRRRAFGGSTRGNKVAVAFWRLG